MYIKHKNPENPIVPMKRYLTAIGLAALLMIGYQPRGHIPQNYFLSPPVATAVLEPQQEDTVKIGSFNIQIFGKAMMAKEDVMEYLADIVKEFDILAIQEVRNPTGKPVEALVNRVNEEHPGYSYLISQPLGRSSTKEEYAFIYQTQRVEFKEGSDYVYDDSQDTFEREPYIAWFSSGGFDYVLVDIHTKPDDATKEIMALEEVVKDALRRISGERDVIILGDFNADGRYFSEAVDTGIRGKDFVWAIPDSMDTTVAASENTYDRVVFLAAYTGEDYTGESGVMVLEDMFGITKTEAKRISDHYPVYAVFSTTHDSM